MRGKPSESTIDPFGRRTAVRPETGPRVGLVLGGGGILGGAWLVGALHALVEATGWDPTGSTHIVGTSAGSVVASLVAEGLPTWFMVHHQTGGDVDGVTDRYGEPLRHADEGSRRLRTWTGQIPRLLLGSPGLALRTTLQPWRFPPTTALSGWVGRGFLSTDEIGRMVRSVVLEGWSSHPNLWIVTLDYASGRRVVFGREGGPAAHLWEAVEASCAIPGLYRPVRIGGRLYVDGGVWSPSNLDLLTAADLDIVIALNPMSSLQPGLPTTIAERVERRVRAASGRRFGREARRLRSGGVSLLLIQPEAEDLNAMGINLMDPSRRSDVLRTAISTVETRLREPDAEEVLADLGRG
ncbi:MAG: patatin-like phospholipase family protein [Actinomycetota bacterium]